MNAILISAILAFAAPAAARPAPVLPAGSRYVAMGSSYAAGQGIGPLVAGTLARCGRTGNNYAHLVAARLKLGLVDVSCGGATTADVLDPWLELPAQIDAVTADTRLVTITIGGNDLNYVRNLMSLTCRGAPGTTAGSGRPCLTASWPTEADYRALGQHLRQIAREVRRRAPAARLVFVDYLRIVPETGGCADVPVDAADAPRIRETFRRLAEVTRDTAVHEGAMLLPAGRLSERHDACSATPWAAGKPGRPTDWHPTAAGQTGIADALVALLQESERPSR